MRPSSSIRILRSMSAAATRKWPEPMQGSMTVISAARSGQPSNVPAAGVPSSRKRRYSQSFRSGLSGWRPAHQAPSEFSSRKRTM